MAGRRACPVSCGPRLVAASSACALALAGRGRFASASDLGLRRPDLLRVAASCQRPIWAATSSPLLSRPKAAVLPRRRQPRLRSAAARPWPRLPPHASPCARSSSPCLEAFALIFVPSSATWPSFTRAPLARLELARTYRERLQVPLAEVRRQFRRSADQARRCSGSRTVARRLGGPARQVDACDSRTAARRRRRQIKQRLPR